MSARYPRKVTQLLLNFDGWLVGSAADPEKENPRDYDIIIPFHLWHKACLVVPKDAMPNSIGGWKFIVEEDGTDIDIWPGDLSYFLQRPGANFAYHMASDTMVRKYAGTE